jgi:hypothetical protein
VKVGCRANNPSPWKIKCSESQRNIPERPMGGNSKGGKAKIKGLWSHRRRRRRRRRRRSFFRKLFVDTQAKLCYGTLSHCIAQHTLPVPNEPRVADRKLTRKMHDCMNTSMLTETHSVRCRRLYIQLWSQTSWRESTWPMQLCSFYLTSVPRCPTGNHEVLRCCHELRFGAHVGYVRCHVRGDSSW